MIPVNRPSITDLERQYVADALGSGWLTRGAYVDRFQAEFAAFCGRRHCVAVSSGTVALWAALTALELPDGAVAVPAYTCDAVGNAARIVTGWRPRAVDAEAETWGMDAGGLREALDGLSGPVRAAVLVHTYGVPARDTLAIEALCAERGIPLIEDGSEAHGARLGGRPAGSFGRCAVFSLRGEKILAGGQMGCVAMGDPALAERVRYYAENGLPFPNRLRYWSTGPGLNLLCSNLHAALALAQLHRADELIAARRRVHAGWRDALGAMPGLSFQAPHGDPIWWLTAIRIGPAFTRLDPRDLAAALAEAGVETRPGFTPLSWMPHLERGDETPVADALYRSLLVLPSGPDVTAEDQARVKAALLRVTGRAQ
mgnify:FL=1